MDLVLNGMEELNEQELMMVDGGGSTSDKIGAVLAATATVYCAVVSGGTVSWPMAIAVVNLASAFGF